MTDLLDPPGARATRGAAPADPPRRPLVLGAAVAGVGAALLVLFGCMAVAVAGWFASDTGGHGTTRDALRVASDGWLLAHGAHLGLATGAVSATVTAVPLGLTLLCLYAAHRLGRWAARTSAVEDARTLVLGVLVMAATYGLVGLVVALLASTATAELGLLRSFAGTFAVALTGGGTGLLREGRDAFDWAAHVPERVRAVVLGAVASALSLFAAASALLTVALLLDLGSAANVLSRLHADAAGGLLYTVVVAAVAPNAVLLAGAYLLGPGFAVGTGTLVSPAVVTLGPVPAFPLLAALPSPGTPPTWLSALVAAPVAAALLGTVLMLRRHPALTYDAGALRGLGSGVLGGLLLSAAIALAGGSVGPGRMADVGAELLDTVVSSTVPMGVGGLFAGIAATWWARRH
jgi:Family of unknown function (DUF6350)